MSLPYDKIRVSVKLIKRNVNKAVSPKGQILSNKVLQLLYLEV
ncbi:hypothetical protein Q5C_09665 [Leuconostoc pseudomesenteroides 4882]|nr:hypothetical protein Q5C_09665 [Leuconostoc pseudomesenteroides 4882]